MRNTFTVASAAVLCFAGLLFGQTQINPVSQVNWPATTGSGAPTQYCPTNASGTLTNLSSTVTAITPTGVLLNQTVTGTGVPTSTTVTGINATAFTLTLSQAATSGGVTAISFYSLGMPYTDTLNNVHYVCGSAGWIKNEGATAPGGSYKLPAYGSASSSALSPSNVGTDSTGNTLTVPGAVTLSGIAPGSGGPNCLQISSAGVVTQTGSICGSGSGGDTITTPNGTLTIGGTSTNTTLDVLKVPTTLTSAGSTFYCGLFASSSTTYQAVDVATACSLNPSTGVLSATSFSGVGTGLTGTASSLSVGGSAGSVGHTFTMNSGGSGAASPATFNGSAAVTLSYNTLGAPGLAATTNTFTGTTNDFSGTTQLKHPVAAAYVSVANGELGYDTTNLNWHGWLNGLDRLLALMPTSGIASGHCVEFLESTNSWSLQDAGAACSSGAGDSITSPNGTLTIGGTSTSTTLDVLKTPTTLVSASSTYYCGLFAANSTTYQAVDVATACTLNPSTGTLSATNLVATSLSTSGVGPVAVVATDAGGELVAGSTIGSGSVVLASTSSTTVNGSTCSLGNSCTVTTPAPVFSYAVCTGPTTCYTQLSGNNYGFGESPTQQPSPSGGAISGLNVYLNSGDPGSGNTVEITLRVGGISQSLTCTITGNGSNQSSCQDTTHAVSLSLGNLVDWQIITTDPTASDISISAKWAGQ
jgi:hypothetical protein